MIIYRYFNNNSGLNRENEVKALHTAYKICEKEKNIDEIILLIHTKKNTGYIKRIFETNNVNIYFQGVKVRSNFPPVRIETIKNFSDDYQSKIVLVCFGLHSYEIYKYEDYENIVGIIAHQRIETDVQNWAKTYGAINIETNKEIEKTRLPNFVVQNAFKDLSESINMSTGITHSDDNNKCKTYIRALKKYGYNLDSQEILSLLVTKLNWRFDDANDVIKLIDKINSGSYFKGGEKTGLKHYIELWKEH